MWVQRATPSAGATPSPAAQVAKRPSPSQPICLDSLDEDLTAPSLDISQALAILGNVAKGLAQGDSPPSPEGLKAAANPPSLHASPLMQQKKNAVGTPGASAPHYISTSLSSSTSLCRTPPNVASPLPSVRVDGMGLAKGTPQAHRHSVMNTQRPLGVAKANMPASASPPKPRPPATASPLVAPGSKAGVSTPPSGLLKGSNNTKASVGEAVVITSPQQHVLSSASLLTKAFQTPRLPQAPPSKPAPSLAQAQPQSSFITPMHATLTKSTHSSNPPIIKLTPRTPNPSVTAPPSQSPRSQATPALHQYSPKTPAGFRPPFSGVQGGAVKPGQSIYTPPGGQKPPPTNSSSTTTSLINASSISKHSGSSASPTVAPANAGQRQRPVGGTAQGAKPVTSVSSSKLQVGPHPPPPARCLLSLKPASPCSVPGVVARSARLRDAGGDVPVPPAAEPAPAGPGRLRHGGRRRGGRQQRPVLHPDPE